MPGRQKGCNFRTEPDSPERKREVALHNGLTKSRIFWLWTGALMTTYGPKWLDYAEGQAQALQTIRREKKTS